jgi:hypothetical protein
MYLKLNGNATHQVNVFNTWLFIEHPEFLKDGDLKNNSLKLKSEIYDSKNAAREALKKRH